MGLDKLSGYKVENYKGKGSDASVVYSYIDENNERQKKEVGADQIAMQLAAAEAAKTLGAQTDSLIETFNKLETSTSKAD
mgnify:CR=1 FL=1